MTTEPPACAQHRVHFSKFSVLAKIPYHDVESKWYTREEDRLFKQNASADIRRLRVFFDGAPAIIHSKSRFSCCAFIRKKF
jgi:hypothetical protein